MNFLIYENAQPILEEYPPSVAMRMLLEKHGDEFPEKYVESMVTAAELCLTETDSQFLYSSYVTAVAQIRWDMKQRKLSNTI